MGLSSTRQTGLGEEVTLQGIFYFIKRSGCKGMKNSIKNKLVIFNKNVFTDIS